MSELECMDGYDGRCKGTVEWRAVPGGMSLERCEYHFGKRMERRANSMEMYADSDLAPSWFDPSYAGERWEED